MNFNGLSEKNAVYFEDCISKINTAIDNYRDSLYAQCGKQKNVAEAMYYSLSAGGKRIRPVLTMEFCRICGGNDALSAALAVEMIHTFSLIHDDLPCMDDDDFRRGKPSCHRAFGETTALLAGDALENAAFNIIVNLEYSDKVKCSLIKELSYETGVLGMIGGQVIDTEYSGQMDEALLLDMYRMKTGALLKAACKMGCICADAGLEKLLAADTYAENLGLAFQIIDDILDIEGSSEELGKPSGSDAANGKVTYASLNGISKSREYAQILTDNALAALNAFDDTDFLREFTMYLLDRNK